MVGRSPWTAPNPLVRPWRTGGSTASEGARPTVLVAAMLLCGANDLMLSSACQEPGPRARLGHMDAPKTRAWWSHAQGLDGSLAKASAAGVLKAAGWARSVAGAGPYLTLFSRNGSRRAGADAAVAAVEICELPSARGCTYVLPAADFALGLKVGESFSESEMNTARKLGVTDKEIQRLCAAMVNALGRHPMAPEAIREAVAGAARNLGEAGKKKGVITTLPVALGILQAQGEIRRVPLNGRLDQQRYGYVRWTPNPLTRSKLTAEEAFTELARRFFSWIGPATLAEFQWFSGLGVKAAQSAVAPLRLAPIAPGDSRLMHAADHGAFESLEVPKEPRYALVSSLDGISQHRRDVRGLVAEEDLNRKVPVEKGVAELGTLKDLPSHAILDRGRLVGLWEYDVSTEAIVWIAFVPASAALKEAIQRTEEFVRSDLGDARSFSLDSPKSREPKIAALRAIARRSSQ